MSATALSRRLPVGAEIAPGGGVHFRVWAPRRRSVEVALEPRQRRVSLHPEEGGYFAGVVADAAAGTRYRFVLDGENQGYPDPASRFQPEGPHGPSEVVDASTFPWTDGDWPGVHPLGQVIYEMHIGTFTSAGTWGEAARQLPELARLGVTTLEVMPVSDFPGRFGWGYDGVNLFAPTRLYGAPDDFRALVDRAHACGLGVILDVVYNHFGPDGNYLRQFAESYFTKRYGNEWGEAINFDGPDGGPVREFFIANAGYWVDEFHLDGVRLDATQQIFDASAHHILADIARTVRAAARGRDTLLVAENETQEIRLIQPVEQGGYGLDALWNDDFHHSARVLLTGRRQAYYTDYRGAAQEFVSAAKCGYLYQGQYYSWQKKRRGTPTFGIAPGRFVQYLENHDQVANSARGLRMWSQASRSQCRAMTALLLLGPGTPMLFQGQEFASSSPFLFFADQEPDLARLVRKGRAQFLSQFPALATPQVQEHLPDAADPQTFAACKLDLAEREAHTDVYRLHHDLLQLRREDPVLRPAAGSRLDGAVLGPRAFVLRFFGRAEDRLLVVNFDADLHLRSVPEPFLAPPGRQTWRLIFSTEDLRYGGSGTAPPETEDGWHLPGQAALLLAPAPVPSLG